MQTMKSELDKSVNFVEENLKGFIEARYVRRADNYFSCYLSSQSGCNKGCRFCHLTATGQTSFNDVAPEGFIEQAKHVFEHYRKEAPAKLVHYSFMARGEALANKHMLDDGDSILYELGKLAVAEKLRPKFNISTIMPYTLRKPLSDVFKIVTPTIYYSLYSMDEAEFRPNWLPAAMPAMDALKMLKDYQEISKKIVKIHFAFIKGWNDEEEGVHAICDAIDSVGLICEFNLVRYNPFSPEQGVESDIETINRNFAIMQKRMTKAKVINRVGFDVKASCGMFVQ